MKWIILFTAQLCNASSKSCHKYLFKITEWLRALAAVTQYSDTSVMCVSIYTTLASKNSLHKVLIELHAALQNADADIILALTHSVCVRQRVKAKELVNSLRLVLQGALNYPRHPFPKSSLHAFREKVSLFLIFCCCLITSSTCCHKSRCQSVIQTPKINKSTIEKRHWWQCMWHLSHAHSHRLLAYKSSCTEVLVRILLEECWHSFPFA